MAYRCNSHLHAAEVGIETADVDVQPVVGVLREAPLLVPHAHHKVDATVDLVLSRPQKAAAAAAQRNTLRHMTQQWQQQQHSGTCYD